MTDAVLVGIDVGTSATKAVALDVDGAERAWGSAPTPWSVAPTGAEARAESLLDAALSAVHDTLSRVNGAVLGVGVTSMAETGVLLDGDGRPLTPAVAWNDRRAAEDGDAMADDLGAENVARRTGLTAGRKLTAAIYRWLARNEPAVKTGRRWLSLAEWVVHALGGDAVAEASLASRTGWLDLDHRDWWSDAVAWSGIDQRALPAVRTAGSPMGVVSADGGRLAGAVLTVAGHDHQAAAVGAGATRLGDVLDSCGTAEAFVRGVPAPVDAPARQRLVAGGLSVGWHVLSDRMAVLAGFRSGDRLQRLLDALGCEDRTELERRARRAPPPPAPLSLEALDALVTAPTHDLMERARQRHGTDTPVQLWHAACGGVARHGAEVLRRLEELTGPRRRLLVVGGWAQEGCFAAAKEALLGPFLRPDVSQAGARGAALLAGVAAEVLPGAVSPPAPPMITSMPEASP